jgi:hypothetical protein
MLIDARPPARAPKKMAARRRACSLGSGLNIDSAGSTAAPVHKGLMATLNHDHSLVALVDIGPMMARLSRVLAYMSSVMPDHTSSRLAFPRIAEALTTADPTRT